MAHPSDQRSCCSPGVLRLVLFLMGLFLVGYTVKPPIFLQIGGGYGNVEVLCPFCDCDDCSFSQTETIISLPSGGDCGKDDPEVNEEMKKNIIALMSEEISLQRNVSSDSLEHTKALIMDARKTSSLYQREAEKCNIGMETCEGTREKAQAALIEERKLSALWEERAREYGWEDKKKT